MNDDFSGVEIESALDQDGLAPLLLTEDEEEDQDELDDALVDDEGEPDDSAYPLPSAKLSKRVDERLGREQLRSQRRFQLRVAQSLTRNVEVMIDLAQGVCYEEEGPEGKRRVYTKLPNTQILMFLVEHGIGKATARQKSNTAPVIKLVHQVPRPKRQGKDG